MKRKIISLLMMVMIGLTACGGNTENESADISETRKEESVETHSVEEDSKETDAVNSTEEKVEWETRDLGVFEVPETTSRTVTSIDGTELEIGTTFLDYDFATIEKTIRESAFITENYNLGKQREEEFKSVSTAEENYYTAEAGESIVGFVKGNDDMYITDFTFSLKQDHSCFDNYSSMYINFSRIPVTSTTQEEIHNVLKDTLQDDFAEFLVYGRGNGSVGAAMEQYSISFDSTFNYSLSRKVEYNEDNTWNVSFHIFFYTSTNLAYDKYHGEYTSLTTDMKYNLSEATNINLGKFDISNAALCTNGYFDIDTGTEVKGVRASGSYEEIISDNGKNEYTFYLYLKPMMDGFEYSDYYETNIAFSVKEDNGTVSFAYISVEGDNEDYLEKIFPDLSKEELLVKAAELGIKQLEIVAPHVDSSIFDPAKFSEAATFFSIEEKSDTTVLGKEYTQKVELERFGWKISYTEKQ